MQVLLVAERGGFEWRGKLATASYASRPTLPFPYFCINFFMLTQFDPGAGGGHPLGIRCRQLRQNRIISLGLPVKSGHIFKNCPVGKLIESAVISQTSPNLRKRKCEMCEFRISGISIIGQRIPRSIHFHNFFIQNPGWIKGYRINSGYHRILHFVSHGRK